MSRHARLQSGYTDRYAVFLALLLATIFFVQGFLGNLNKSLTWDEPSFISAGYSYLKWGDFFLNPSHPPLMQDLEAFPLLFLDLKHPARDDPRWRKSTNPVVAFGRQLIFESGNDPRRITTWARLPVLLIGCCLILSLYLWGRRLYSARAALWATGVAALSPNLLAHAKVATEDLGCAAFMFFAVWFLWRALHGDRPRDWSFFGLMTGLALLAKYTSLLLGPICLVLIVYHWLANRGRGKFPLRGIVLSACLAVFIVGAGYNFTFDYSLYLNGIRKIYTDLKPDYLFYFLGKVSPHPRPYYSIVAFLLKVPLPTLVLLVMAAALLFSDRKHREGAVFLLVPVMFIVGMSFFDRQNFGLRRILPAFPFLFLFISQVFVMEKRRLTRYAAVGLVIWVAIEAFATYPHHLSYFNLAAGGARRGPYLLEDSNIDWGQDLPGLAKWQQSHPSSEPLSLLYFGTAVPEAYNVTARPVLQQDIENPRNGTYAISAHNLVYLRKVMSTQPGLNIDWLTRYTPVAYAGHSIYIYRFPGSETRP